MRLYVGATYVYHTEFVRQETCRTKSELHRNYHLVRQATCRTKYVQHAAYRTKFVRQVACRTKQVQQARLSPGSCATSTRSHLIKRNASLHQAHANFNLHPCTTPTTSPMPLMSHTLQYLQVLCHFSIFLFYL